ncbi:hypothetical protein [Paenibacillus phytohabitans]|uniref:hypothetical protein n=1 Tax=Paenibacillus phytohabitans TaxID=2654978 RepID=UPI0030099E25
MLPNLTDIKFIRLMKKINSRHDPIFIPVVTECYAVVSECFPNVERKIKRDGGSIIYGWQVWSTNLICEAEFHAVWKSIDGELVDITPKNPPVDNILFVQDDSIVYKGAQIDNIRINKTDNPLVNDFIDIQKALFKIRNKGVRAFSNEYTLSKNEALIYSKLESFSMDLCSYIYRGGKTNTHCFCESGETYENCHRQELDSLIWLSKTI